MTENDGDYSLGKYQERLIPEVFLCKRVEGGLIYYRPGYPFLGDASEWDAYKVREDALVSPRAALCRCPDDRGFFVERQYDQDGVRSGHFKALCLLHERKYHKVAFEEVMGLKLHAGGDVGYLYHSYSGGVELLWADNFPGELKTNLRQVVVEALIELAKNGIDYHDLLPSNLRYDFDGKLVCNPHNCIHILDRELSLEEQMDNLSCLLYTNSWIENPTEFLDAYFRDALSAEEIQRITKRIQQTMTDMDELGDIIEVPFHWWPRQNR